VSSLPVLLETPEALRTLFDEQLSKGRLWLSGSHAVTERERCEVVLEVQGRTHRLQAEVVHVRLDDPGAGVGLQLARLDEAGLAALRAFVDWREEEERPAEPAGDPQTGTPALHARLAAMTAVQQQRLAASGGLTERVALERLYGPNVWEPLLRNPRITPPEVARIGRKGTLPRPLVELIAANAGWLASGEVQRALLSNPRSTQAVVGKILRSMSRPDLLVVVQQTSYPVQVRQVARQLLGR
jgi:hypothetical protein